MHPLLAQIDARIAARRVLTHPFYQAWQRGELSSAALQDYAAQYYPHVAAFPRYLSTLHAHTENDHTRRALLQNLIDEEAGAPNHPELWLQFAQGLGVSPQRVTDTPVASETRHLVDTFLRVCKDGSVAAGLAALYSYESQIPQVADTKMDGLRAFYGISSPETLAYFAVHKDADVEHSRVERALLAHHLSDPDAADAPASAQAALEAVWGLLSGVCARHGIAC